MADEEAYQRLIAHMRSWVIGMPESDVLMPLVKERLSAAEADFLSRLPFLPHTTEQLAEKLGMQVRDLAAALDPLADRGIVFRHESKDTVRYALNDSLFIWFRSPFWPGRDDETSRRLAVLSNTYYYKAYGREVGGYRTPGLRSIPIMRTVSDTRQIVPYEDVARVLEREEYFCVAHCPCRRIKKLGPDAPTCKHETFNCLHFGRLAKYMVKHGMGKEITREEAAEILRKAADAGLVHGISNTVREADSICNCCSCCCVFLQSARVLGMNGLQRSNYVVQVREDTCEGCGLCVKRCPMEALRLEPSDHARNKIGKVPHLEPGKCIGCGVCAHKCPTRSLSLLHRQGEEDFPEDFREMARRMGEERGRPEAMARRR